MFILDKTLSWGTPHSFRLWQDSFGVHGTLMLVKDNGTQVLSVTFPESVTIDDVLASWRNQGGDWSDLYAPVKVGSLFAVTRIIELKEYRVIWYVLHVNNCPQDACVVIKKPANVPATT